MNNQNDTNQNVQGNVGITPAPQPNTQPSVQPVSNNVQPSVTPVVSPTNTNNGNDDPGAVVNENLKKVEIDYKPPSKFKVFSLVVLFILLVSFVLFLPEITTYINKYMSGELNKKVEKIVNGSMNCTLSTTTANLNKDYDYQFTFNNNALERANFEVSTRGDVTLDEESLDSLNKTCKQLAANTKTLNGVSVTCEYTSGNLVEIQRFVLKDVNSEELDAAFSEAGGTNPGYKYGQDMDAIEKQMEAAGYSCERSKS